MSVGPDNEEKFKVRVVDKVRHGLKVSFEKFFNRPAHYLFYTTVTATALGLFFGMEFSREFYAILLFLSFLNLAQFFYDQWYDNKELRSVQGTDEGSEGTV